MSILALLEPAAGELKSRHILTVPAIDGGIAAPWRDGVRVARQSPAADLSLPMEHGYTPGMCVCVSARQYLHLAINFARPANASLYRVGSTAAQSSEPLLAAWHL